MAEEEGVEEREEGGGGGRRRRGRFIQSRCSERGEIWAHPRYAGGGEGGGVKSQPFLLLVSSASSAMMTHDTAGGPESPSLSAHNKGAERDRLS